jgi:hypothetical protein
MSDYSSTTAELPFTKGHGRLAPSRESQSSLFLFCPPTHELIGSSSNRSHPSIHTLNDDELLNIFYFCRPVTKDEDHDKGGLPLRRWYRQRWWHKLVQVSQRWRYLILASTSYLDLHLLCTYGVPVEDMLAHSPVLPLTILYTDGNREMTPEDEKGVQLALCHYDRVHHIALKMPAPNLMKFIAAMDEQYPILEHIHIASPTEAEESIGPVFPSTFQAPNLRHITLWYAALPIRSPLLVTTVGLVTLWLGGIPQSAYFPPSYILTWLSLMPQLEMLGIGFHSPLPNRDVVRQLSISPILTHVTLLNLREFSFRGVSTYLEALLAQINAPFLSILDVFFFNQLTFTLPRLLQFMQTIENLNFSVVELAFGREFVYLTADSHREEWNPSLYLQIMCIHLDQQVASAVQILDTLSPVLSVVEQLTLGHIEHNQSSEWHNDVDPTQWRELLRPFSNVKVLRVENEPVGLSRSLHLEDGEMPLELLPNLEELSHSGGDVDGAFISFINERQAAGHPVRLIMADGSFFDHPL